MAFAKTSLESTSGAILNLYQKKCDGRAKAAVMILHGMSEHAGRYQRFANALGKAGYCAFAHDHRGHGETKADSAPQGVFAKNAGAAKLVEDALNVNRHIREHHPDLPIILFGHSMGAIIGLNYCIRHSGSIAGAALWNSGVDAGVLLKIYRLILMAERMFKGSDVPSTIARQLTTATWNRKFSPNRTTSDWLSRDEAEVDKFVNDPKCGFALSIGGWLDIARLINEGANNALLSNIRPELPMHLLGGEADPCTDNAKAMVRLTQRLNEAGIKDITCRVVPEARHETLNELCRAEETKNFIAWLDERFA